MLTPDECLGAAWTYCAHGRAREHQFPRGFWPDVAKVAMEMFAQQSTSPKLDFRPTMCGHGDAPEPIRRGKSGIDLSKLEISI